MTDSRTIPSAARWLGYGGLLPFFGLALSFLAGGPLFPGFALQAFLVYAATILAFIGGIRWGTAIHAPDRLGAQLALSVLPPLWAAGALLLPGPLETVLALMTGFAVFAITDYASPHPGAPLWLRRLRVHLSIGAIFSHGLMLWGL